MQQQLGALAASIDDLDARLRETAARVREGTALAGEAAAVEAALLRERQQADELRATRDAARARLERLTGRTIAVDTPLALPDLTAAAARARVGAQEDAAAAGDRPELSAYCRGGYGEPGLNMINDSCEWYALGGLQ